VDESDVVVRDDDVAKSGQSLFYSLFVAAISALSIGPLLKGGREGVPVS
jgi:hypothetical protein